MLDHPRRAHASLWVGPDVRYLRRRSQAIPDPIGLDRPSQQASIGKDSALPLEFIQGARPHPVRQRGQAASDLFPLEAEEILTQGSTSTEDGITVSGQSENADARGLDNPPQSQTLPS